MAERVTKETLAQFEEFIQRHPKGNFAQSYLWGKQKPMWKWEGLISRDETGAVRGAMSVLIRKMPPFGKNLMYGCRAPVCDLEDKDTLYDLLDGCKALAREVGAYAIKIDPDVPSSNTAFARLLTDYGFQAKDGGKNFEALPPCF